MIGLITGVENKAVQWIVTGILNIIGFIIIVALINLSAKGQEDKNEM